MLDGILTRAFDHSSGRSRSPTSLIDYGKHGGGVIATRMRSDSFRKAWCSIADGATAPAAAASSWGAGRSLPEVNRKMQTRLE